MDVQQEAVVQQLSLTHEDVLAAVAACRWVRFGRATRRCFRDFLTARLAATDSEVADHVRGLDDDEMEQLYRAVCEQQDLNNWFVK